MLTNFFLAVELSFNYLCTCRACHIFPFFSKKKDSPPLQLAPYHMGDWRDIAQAERRVSFAPSHPRLEDPEREWKFVTCMN